MSLFAGVQTDGQSGVDDSSEGGKFFSMRQLTAMCITNIKAPYAGEPPETAP